MKPIVLCAALASLVACGDTSRRYLLEDAEPGREMGTAVRMVQVETISLPDYFSGAEILVQNEEGVLLSNKDHLWADAPERGFTEQLADALDQRLTADVASAPWPFEEPSEIKVDVKVRRFVATNTGEVEFKGQYFLSSNYGGDYARANRFDFKEPVTGEGLMGVSAAYGRSLSRLSDMIAKDITRIPRGSF